MADRWIQIDEPDGQLHLWHVGEVDDDRAAAALEAAKAFHAVPADWIVAYMAGEPSWCVSLLEGEPHHTLMSRATVAEFAALAVTAEQLQTHRDGEAARTTELKLENARAALVDLQPADLKALLAEPAVAAIVEVAMPAMPAVPIVDVQIKGG